jgi:hypothetical protein
VASGYQHTIRTFLESSDNKMGRNASTAHYSDGNYIGTVFESHSPGQISSGIAAPVTAECNNFGLKFVTFLAWHNFTSFLEHPHVHTVFDNSTGDL